MILKPTPETRQQTAPAPGTFGQSAYQLQFNSKDKTPKYRQIIQSIITDIERGVLTQHQQLPSISELSIEYYLARDTVEKAYRELRERGYITSNGAGQRVLRTG